MKKLLYLLSLIILFSCDTENSLNCIQASGKIIQQEYELDFFKNIIVWQRVQLIISQGDTQSVIVETGENLINKVKVRVEDSILKVSDRNACNFVRDYDITKVFVTSPNLVKITNSSGLTVTNIGPIEFNRLELISRDPDIQDDIEIHKDGDFRLNKLDVGTLQIKANGLSNFFLSGKAFTGIFGAADGDVRIEAGDLEVFNLIFFHRSTNKMIVNPQNKLKGRIMSLGDVISKNRPPIVNVEEFFTGRLIFE